MRITTLSLRGFRVYEQLDLELPPGLVGIYGPNGAGKSSLLESISWALYGRARTAKGDIRTAGYSGECSVEIGFEHDGHHYTVRRSISGVNATVKARVHVGSLVAADGPAEVGRYLRSTLGMDESAFRSSVFAEQKQLTAFSDNTPDQRRRLVLQLLGITPVEKARDAARDDARAARRAHDEIVSIVHDPEELEGYVREAQDALEAAARADASASAALAGASASAVDAAAALALHGERAARHEAIRTRGVAARERRDRALETISRLEGEQQHLQRLGDELDALRAEPGGHDPSEARTRLDTLQRLERARRTLAQLPDDAPLEAPDEDALARVRAQVAHAEAQHAAARATAASADATTRRAREAADRSEALGHEADCPLCGQALGDGFAAVRAHRAAELSEAETLAADAARSVAAAAEAVAAARAALLEEERRAAERSAELERRATAGARRAAAIQAVADLESELGGPVDRDEIATLTERVRSIERAIARRSELEGILSRTDALTRELDAARNDAAAADVERTALRAELDAVGFDPGSHAAAAALAAGAEAERAAAERAARHTAAELARAEAGLAHASRARDAAREQHAKVRDLADHAVHLGRTADLLNGFRQTLVASVGPRLSIEASSLFNLLTAGEYDGLRIDPETYEIGIIDAGTAYATARFSGSEVDLANLALRVAISEQVRFQTGGQVGLLVLDEALASLDADRKDRMLAALTQLAARFRQILVVTHAPEVKERLPQAIEVVKLPGRRATARVVEPA